jgi:hypothetical protein
MDTFKTPTAARLVHKTPADFLKIMEAAHVRPKPVAFRGRPTQHWALTDIEDVFGRFFIEEEIEHALEPEIRRARNVARYCEAKRLKNLPARQASFRYKGMSYSDALVAAAATLGETT